MTIVQARMSSTRLPGKVLEPIAGVPMVVRVLRRARAIGEPVILATSDDASDDPLAELAHRDGWQVVRGPRDDVLARFIRAIPPAARYIIRITADCPLLDPVVGRAILAALRAGEADYASNTLSPTYPDGLDCEAVTTDALRAAAAEAVLASDREHVTSFVWGRPERFRLLNISRVPDLSSERWTVDDQRDLAFVRAVYDRIGQAADDAGMARVLAILRQEPALRTLNTGHTRNEGYIRPGAGDTSSTA